MRIAVIHHAFDAATASDLKTYMVGSLAAHWEKAGHEVIALYGPDHYEHADVALLHVNLSMVPKPYLQLGMRYPKLINHRITDIRKRRVSNLRVHAGDDYAGAVIVKSDLNHTGRPEKLRQVAHRRWWHFLQPKAPSLESKEYPVYNSLREVPPAYFRDPAYIVEKFLPEREGDFYFLRQSYFFGENHVTWRLRSSAPVIRDQNILDDKEIPTPPAIDRYRRKIGLDYGKIDYIEHDGKTSILDVNKTIGRGEATITESRLAGGIEGFFTQVASR